MSATFERVIEIVSWQSGIPAAKLSATSAIDQDVRISGDDVAEFVDALADEFGDHVLHWPWERFACLVEGLSPLFPFELIWLLLTWPFRGRFFEPSGCDRLELGHIAAVIEKGHWFEP
ncbi:MAG: hypothetical protein P8J20_16960 [Novosphingobium sp.]|nr:hypothetical protein [Novosphingobium sp.]